MSSTSFEKTLRVLDDDPAGRELWALVLTLIIIAAGAVWLFCGRLTVYETSRHARLEAETRTFPIAPAVGGRIVQLHASLGQPVATGEILVALDAQQDDLRREEAKRRLEGLRPELEALERELAAQREVQNDDAAVAERSLQVAQARHDEAELSAHYASEQARRLNQAKSTVTVLDLLKATSEEAQRAAAANAMLRESEKLTLEQRERANQQRAHLEQLHRDLADLAKQIATTEAEIELQSSLIEQHLIRAPVAGIVGEMAPLAVGEVLSASEHIATIVPEAPLVMIADFDPAGALGRIHPGQLGIMRLDGFAWTSYGTLRGRVGSVASEPRDGQVRVELSISGKPPDTFRLQHGLPGRVEVAIEELSPASLLWRAAGHWTVP